MKYIFRLGSLSSNFSDEHDQDDWKKQYFFPARIEDFPCVCQYNITNITYGFVMTRSVSCTYSEYNALFFLSTCISIEMPIMYIYTFSSNHNTFADNLTQTRQY